METNIAEQAERFVARRLENISIKPILSVGNYISLDADCIVAGCTDRTIRFYDTGSMAEVAKSTMEKKNVSVVAVSGMSPEGDDPIIVTGGRDSTIQVWDPTAGITEREIVLPTTEVKSIAVYQGSRTLVVVGTRDARVIVWDVIADVKVAMFKGHRASVYCVCIAVTNSELEYPEDDMDNLCIASGGADRSVRTWDIHTGKRVKKFRHARSISSIIVTNRGIRPLLATAGVERAIKLWDLQTGILLRSFTGHLDQINTLALWEGNQMLIISGSSDHTLRIYDMLSGECICILPGHKDAVLSLTIADADHPKIVSSADDLAIIVWDLDLIINTFYDNSIEGDGERTDEPCYLPIIPYTAPEELDRSQLSKDERRRIRKDRRKAKRLRNLKRYNSSAQDGYLDGDFDDDLDMDDDQLDEDQVAKSTKFDANDKAETIDTHRHDKAGKEDGEQESEIRRAEHIEGSDSTLPLFSLPPTAAPSSSSSAVADNCKGSTIHTQQVSKALVTSLWQRVFGNNKVGILPIEPQQHAPSSLQLAALVTPPPNEVVMLSSTASSIKLSSQSPVPSTPNHTRPQTSSRDTEQEDYQSITKKKQSCYEKANAAHDFEHSRLRSKAAEKLAKRLNLKLNNNDNETDDEDDPTNKEFQAIKAEKLKQHKKLEQKRQQGLAASQNRSANALQRRLEDLAMRRKMQQEGQSGPPGQKLRRRGNSMDFIFEEADDDEDSADEAEG